jgi:hypothetical protein
VPVDLTASANPNQHPEPSLGAVALSAVPDLSQHHNTAESEALRHDTTDHAHASHEGDDHAVSGRIHATSSDASTPSVLVTRSGAAAASVAETEPPSTSPSAPGAVPSSDQSPVPTVSAPRVLVYVGDEAFLASAAAALEITTLGLKSASESTLLAASDASVRNSASENALFGQAWPDFSDQIVIEVWGAPSPHSLPSLVNAIVQPSDMEPTPTPASTLAPPKGVTIVAKYLRLDPLSRTVRAAPISLRRCPSPCSLAAFRAHYAHLLPADVRSECSLAHANDDADDENANSVGTSSARDVFGGNHTHGGKRAYQTRASADGGVVSASVLSGEAGSLSLAEGAAAEAGSSSDLYTTNLRGYLFVLLIAAPMAVLALVRFYAAHARLRRYVNSR